jgi:hypothetical protein
VLGAGIANLLQPWPLKTSSRQVSGFQRVCQTPDPACDQGLIAPDGSMHNVRLKRYVKGEKKIGDWQWRENAFSGTRELNGLRVMMALLNHWDLKDDNNSIYEEKGDLHNPSLHYAVSDLGSSFGTTGLSFPEICTLTPIQDS